MKQSLLLLLLVFATCNGQKKMTDNATQEESQASETGLKWVASDAYSGTDQAKTLIIKDAKGLQKFYSQINRSRKPGLPVPEIDFSKEIVIVRCSGKTDNGTLPILYVKDQTKGELVLGIRNTDKKYDSSAITTPFTLYRMPVTERKIVVRE